MSNTRPPLCLCFNASFVCAVSTNIPNLNVGYLWFCWSLLKPPSTKSSLTNTGSCWTGSLHSQSKGPYSMPSLVRKMPRLCALSQGLEIPKPTPDESFYIAIVDHSLIFLTWRFLNWNRHQMVKLSFWTIKAMGCAIAPKLFVRALSYFLRKAQSSQRPEIWVVLAKAKSSKFFMLFSQAPQVLDTFLRSY